MGCPVEIKARPGLTPRLTSLHSYENFKLQEKSFPNTRGKALFLFEEKSRYATATLSLFPLLAHDSTPFAAC
jgi:hypothetical protein